MDRIDGIVLTFVLNALWLVPAAFAVGLVGTAFCGARRPGCATPSGWRSWRSR
jgi:hypothetical protein